MQEVWIRDEYIRLGQALKLGGLVGSGVDAKRVIQEGLVTVNHTVVRERGRKLYNGDVAAFEGEEILIRNDY